jgi:hypothetical protein
MWRWKEFLATSDDAFLGQLKPELSRTMSNEARLVNDFIIEAIDTNWHNCDMKSCAFKI